MASKLQLCEELKKLRNDVMEIKTYITNQLEHQEEINAQLISRCHTDDLWKRRLILICKSLKRLSQKYKAQEIELNVLNRLFLGRLKDSWCECGRKIDFMAISTTLQDKWSMSEVENYCDEQFTSDNNKQNLKPEATVVTGDALMQAKVEGSAQSDWNDTESNNSSRHEPSPVPDRNKRSPRVQRKDLDPVFAYRHFGGDTHNRPDRDKRGFNNRSWRHASPEMRPRLKLLPRTTRDTPGQCSEHRDPSIFGTGKPR